VALGSLQHAVNQQRLESIKQVARVVRSRPRFGVILHGKASIVRRRDAFNDAVVQVDVAHDAARERVGRDRVVVVLRGDLNATRDQVLNGVVTAMVPEGQFVCRTTERAGEQLVTETNAKNRNRAEQRRQHSNVVAERFTVSVVPSSTSADEVRELQPDGVFLSNGPGDPAALGDNIAVLSALLGTVPIFGICLGHQLLASALGGSTYKLPFGHHGSNHPVQDLVTGRIEITA
jgi:hypothetical protein